MAGQSDHAILGDDMIALKIGHISERVSDTKREFNDYKQYHSDEIKEIKKQVAELAAYHKEDHDQLTKLQGKIDKVESAVIQSIQTSESRAARLESLINEKIELTLKTQTLIEGHLLEKFTSISESQRRAADGLEKHMDEEMKQRKEDNDRLFGYMRDIRKEMEAVVCEVKKEHTGSIKNLTSRWWTLLTTALVTVGSLLLTALIYIWQNMGVNP